MKVRICPCGERLVRKSYESAAQFEKRKYCGCKCKGKYHRDPPKTQAFGLQVPKDRSLVRTGNGLHRYLDDRQLWEVING